MHKNVIATQFVILLCTGLNLNSMDINTELIKQREEFKKYVKFNKFTRGDKLNLKKHELQKIIPGVFQDPAFAYVKELRLSENELECLVPNTFVGLENVKWLYLDHNLIAHIDPQAFEGLPHLTDLHLTFNRLTTILGNTFKPVKTLNLLALNNNQISEVDSNAFNGLAENLKTLYLQYNRLKNIPQDTLSLPQLNVLYLNDNQLQDVNNIFAGATCLKLLELRHNMLTQIEKSTLDSLSDLCDLYLIGMKTNLTPDTMDMLRKLKKQRRDLAIDIVPDY